MDTSSTRPPATLGDTGLWACVQADDADAFALVFDRHQARVHRHALRWADSTQDAEDLVAAVFLEAWRRRADVPVVDGSVLPWLLATANNLQRNRSRSGHRGRRALERLRSGAATTVPDHADDVAARLDPARRAAAVRRAFARLDPLAQDVLTLCVLEGHPMTVAADLLGCPVGTVKSRLSRAKARMRHALVDLDAATPSTPSPLRPALERTLPCAP